MELAEIQDWQAIVREKTGNSAYKIPADLVEIYSLTGGFDFRWECQSDSGDITGSMVLPSLPELYQNDDEVHQTMEQCMASWRKFDNISPDKFTALRLDGGTAGLLCVFFKGGRAMPMKTSPKEYINVAADHLTISGWQVRDVSKEQNIVRELAAWD